MENREGARERSSERETISSSKDGMIREMSSADIPAPSPGHNIKQTEKKLHSAQPRSSVVTASHHRSSHSVDRPGQSSSTGGALDLQSLAGRSGSLSSISGITVPIRLDALSYLLNNAVLGAYNMPSQMPCYPPMYPSCPYPQMGYPYSTFMNPPPGNAPYMNLVPGCQPGLMPCGSQQGVPPFQNPVPNFNQCMSGATPSLFPNTPLQSGIPFNNPTPSVQDNRGNFQSDSNTLSRKVNYGFGNNNGNPFSSDSEKPSSPPRRSFVRFGDKQSDDAWSGRPQNSFNRGSGRGRGDFGGRSWQGNSNGQERRFGDKSWNTDSGGWKRFKDSPDQSQDRGSSFKRGRWQNGRGRDAENRDNWQERNKQNFKAGTFQDRFKSNEEEKVIAKTDESKAKDEDWEMDYAEEPAASKTKSCESPQSLEPPNKPVNDNEEISVKEYTTNLNQEKEEGELESFSDKLATMEIKPQVEDKDPASEPVDNSAEKTVEVGEECRKEDIYALIISADGDDNKGILVQVDTEGQ
ncbi:piRNA-mediated silencing protein C19orf84 homolog [Rhinoderma darwinii]|uniref:piRNA-mediated silencing protein C19orf84 homolog n=1 Tax=Rhinoderma darwinii TaxID=43563 RepID=UPI003F66892D